MERGGADVTLWSKRLACRIDGLGATCGVAHLTDGVRALALSGKCGRAEASTYFHICLRVPGMVFSFCGGDGEIR
jgi:hypothetical protein